MKAPALLFALPIALATTACGGDDTGTVEPDAGDDIEPDASEEGCTVTDWNAPDFEDNAADALALRAQLSTLKSNMESAEGEGTIDRAALDNLYEAGDPSLAAAVTGAYDGIIEKTFNDFELLVTHQNPDLTDGSGNWTGGGGDREGGVVAGRGLDGAGNEPVQLMEKGLFGAAQYHYALELTEDDITPATIDALAALWGSNEDLDPAEDRRTNSAHYSYGMGFHADIAEALTAAKAYAADDECATERDAAIESFFRQWEQALLARAVFYVNAGNEGVAAAGDDDDIANALHALSEGLGLAFGFYGIPDPSGGPLDGAGRVITDGDIETIMEHLGFDNSDGDTLSVSTTAEIFVDNEGDARDTAQSDFEDVIKTVYDLDDTDIEEYYDPTAG